MSFSTTRQLLILILNCYGFFFANLKYSDFIDQNEYRCHYAYGYVTELLYICTRTVTGNSNSALFSSSISSVLSQRSWRN